MWIDIVTIFPKIFSGFLESSLLAKARQKGLISIRPVDLRLFTTDKHHAVDDAPYGGGSGMVMLVAPIWNAVETLSREHSETKRRKVILTSPQGELFTQAKAEEFATAEHLIIICGRYQGVDERVKTRVITDEISIGDYVLNGGEVAAMVIVEAVFRLQPGAIGKLECTETDSIASGLLEYPQYTRPEEFRGERVPEILLSGHHEQIRRWRRQQSLLKTKRQRPDLFGRVPLTNEDRLLLKESETSA